MLYKNIVLAITSVLTLIMAAMISGSYYKYNAKDYSTIEEYVGNDTIDISKDVKIENIDYLYFECEGIEYIGGDFAYKTIYIKSLMKNENRYSEIAELFVITYNGQRLNFDYEISLADKVITQEYVSSGAPVKFIITSKDKNIKGTLDFELPTQGALKASYEKKSLPMIIYIALGADFVICIIFAIIDGITEKGFFCLWFDLPDFHFGSSFHRVQEKPLSPEELENLKKREEEEERQRKEAARIAEAKKRLERIKSYEAKYDLTKAENMVFKELAYDTLYKLFPNETDYKKPKITSKLNNTDKK